MKTNCRRLTPACLLVIALATAAAGPGPDLTQLRGTWDLTGGEINGKPLSPRVLGRHFRLVVDDGKWDNLVGDDPKPQHLTFTLDPTASPKRVDLVDPTDAHPADEGEVGIYKVDGDTLTVNLAGPGDKDRPSNFHSAKPTTVLRVYTRSKP